jgi:AcrR family transcriptional regulator
MARMAKGLPVLGQPEAKRERADAQHNRARILDAARKLMKRRALDQICMDELAALAGVGKGTLYRRFEDKQALLHALLDDDERALQDEVRRTFREHDSAHAALIALLEKLHAFSLEHAPVLAAAEASARGQAHFESPPYQWRHAVIAEHLERAGVAKGPCAAHLADVLLSSMSGEVLARALATQPAPEVQAEARAYFHAVCKMGLA